MGKVSRFYCFFANLLVFDMIFRRIDKGYKESSSSEVVELIENYNIPVDTISLSLINNAKNDKGKIRVFRDFRVTDKR